LQGEYESASEEEQDNLKIEGKFQDSFEEEDHTYCEIEKCDTPIVTQILSVQVKEAENGK
jgi:hypothetical protein